MNPQPNVSLSEYSTMGLGGQAAWLVEITERSQIPEALSWATDRQLAVVMIGGGSNVIWGDAGWPGLVMINRIGGYEVYESGDNVYLTVGAGENWDSVVARSVEAGLTGIEALSLIPGSAGATPVQNVGAYGQEMAQTLTTLVAYDSPAGNFVTLTGSECAFGYRTSRFKTTDRGRFFITNLTIGLRRGNPLPPFYGAVQTYFQEHGVTEYTPGALRQAVMDIRAAKLPDPALVHNTGSFFHNPIVSQTKYEELAATYDALPHWPADGGVKLSGAWLIEQAGFKDVHDKETGMATWPNQSLVLVNEQAQSTADLLKFRQKILDAVSAKFGVTLEQEPELLS